MSFIDLDMKKIGQAPRIRYEGVFDFGELLKRVRKFYTDRLYTFTEKKYKEKGTDYGKESEISWVGWRKINEYVKYNITIMFHAWDLTEVEIVKEGKKIKTNKGRILVEIGAQLELDYENRFETSKFMESVRTFYHKYIIKPELGSIYGDRLYYHAYKLHAIVKDFFDMQTNYNAYVDMW